MPTRSLGAALAAALFLFALPLHAQSWTSQRPDGHAPIGVMGDHTHGAGEVMFSYRYMFMPMEGSLLGTDEIADADVISPTGSNFLVTPTEMPMQMHMLGAMFAPANDLTLMLMVPLVFSEMDHVTRMGGTFQTESGGLGDVKLSALYTLARPGRSRIHANLGVSFPTGSIDEQDVNPMSMGNEVRLPYPMQIGSGTFDVMPGVTYLGQADAFSWGSQVSAKVRLGENSNDYRFGNVYGGTAWGAYKINDLVSASVRAEAMTWGDVDGADPAYAMAVANRVVPTVFSDLRGGTRLDAGLGVNFFVPSGSLHNLRVGAEVMLPVFQDLDGPQLEVDSMIEVGLQYSFGLFGDGHSH
ncbi:MAG: transporter [Bacteroidota bacterium]